MREQIFTIATSDRLLNIDTNAYGDYIAITDKGEIITPVYRTGITPGICYHMVRKLSDELFLVSAASSAGQDNAFIYHRNGTLQTAFFAGTGIADILVFDNRIVFTYFDEGVFGNEGPNTEGLTVFNFSGEQLFGFNSVANWLIADCYCACKLDNSHLLFYAYTDFQVIQLNLDTFAWKQLDTPKDFLGASSMAATDKQVIFHSTYNNKTDFFLWDIVNNSVVKKGTFKGTLSGLTNGKFMILQENGFTIISPLEA